MKAVLFDLDNTLYPSECDLFSLIDVRINRFMKDVAAIDSQDVDVLRRRYWKDYGATLQGLIRHHDIDPEDYLDYVHSVDVGSRLSLMLNCVLLSRRYQSPAMFLPMDRVVMSIASLLPLALMACSQIFLISVLLIISQNRTLILIGRY